MRRIIVLGIVFVVLSGCGVGAWYGWQTVSAMNEKVHSLEKENARLTSPPLSTDADIISRVSTFMILPEGTPKVVPVVDVETLRKSQPFFAKAQNGDKLLIYPAKVILYSPSLDRIVEVAQIK